MVVCGGAIRAAVPAVQAGVHPLLDVPYVAQTPELCGGAAVSMVLRYWGERGVFPEDFASLVVASEGGIPTGALAAAVRDRQWQALEVPPDAAIARSRIRSEIDQGRPLIALIAVAPRTYHYVVIAGATDQEVILHDPARAPFQVVGWSAFDDAWAQAGRWLLLILPPDGRRGAAAAPETPPPAAAGAPPVTPCEALVDRGVGLAIDGDRDGAERALAGATRLCPASAAAWRELAGLRFAESRWAEAASLAERAVDRAPDDEHARRLLGTSRFLSGDPAGALDAWTPLGEPRIDAITVHGAERTRHPVVVQALGLQPRQLLTSAAYTRAARRLRELPAVSGARLRYEPLDGGLANVDAFITERAKTPTSWLALASLAGQAAVNHELRFEEAGALGAGERVTASWRWSRRRPRVTLGMATPAPGGLPGVLSVSALWEKQTYLSGRESRRRAEVSLSDWASSWLHWDAGSAIDRFGGRAYASAEVEVDTRWAGDTVAVIASAGGWAPLDGGHRFQRASARLAFRSMTEDTPSGWTGAVSFTSASRAAPKAVWEGAGTGNARAGLLRARRLIDDDVLVADVFGRDVLNGTIEYARPVARVLTAGVAVAGFVDAARAWRRADGAGPSPFYIDAGIGLRLSAAGRPEFVRIDFARGIRGGGARVSVTWGRAWPR